MARQPEPPNSKPSRREAKLAQALRANLRRRKPAPDPSPPPAAGKDEDCD